MYNSCRKIWKQKGMQRGMWTSVKRQNSLRKHRVRNQEGESRKEDKTWCFLILRPFHISATNIWIKPFPRLPLPTKFYLFICTAKSVQPLKIIEL